ERRRQRQHRLVVALDHQGERALVARPQPVHELGVGMHRRQDRSGRPRTRSGSAASPAGVSQEATIPSPPTAPGTMTAPFVVGAPLPATLTSSTPPLPPVCTYRNRPPLPAAVAASTAPGPVAVLPSRLSCPLGDEAMRLSDGVPALDANRKDPTGRTQQV